MSKTPLLSVPPENSGTIENQIIPEAEVN